MLNGPSNKECTYTDRMIRRLKATMLLVSLKTRKEALSKACIYVLWTGSGRFRRRFTDSGDLEPPSVLEGDFLTLPPPNLGSKFAV